MSETAVIAALWCVFGASHIVLSSRALRARAVAKLGKGRFAGLYSLVATITFVPVAWYYVDHRHSGEMFWLNVPEGIGLGAFYAVMNMASILIAAGLITPSPTLMGAKMAEPRGVHWLTRHALFMGLALWAALHVALMGFASDLAFFGGFIIFTIVGSAHQDARKLADEKEAGGVSPYTQFVAATPFLPFTGRHVLRGLRELSIPAVVVGTGACVGIRYLHFVLA